MTGIFIFKAETDRKNAKKSNHKASIDSYPPYMHIPW